MQMNREQVAAAINAGLALTDPEADLLDTFRRHASGVLLLRGILQGVAVGNIMLQPVPQEQGPGLEQVDTPVETPTDEVVVEPAE